MCAAKNKKEFVLDYADGFYLSRNGEPVVDFVGESQADDGDFANRLLTLLNETVTPVRSFKGASRHYVIMDPPLGTFGMCKFEIQFGYLLIDSGEWLSAPLRVEWLEITDTLTSPRLSAFDDAWLTLSLVGDVIKVLGELSDKNAPPLVFQKVLRDRGFIRYVPPSESDSNVPYIKQEESGE